MFWHFLLVFAIILVIKRNWFILRNHFEYRICLIMLSLSLMVDGTIDSIATISIRSSWSHLSIQLNFICYPTLCCLHYLKNQIRANYLSVWYNSFGFLCPNFLAISIPIINKYSPTWFRFSSLNWCKKSKTCDYGLKWMYI